MSEHHLNHIAIQRGEKWYVFERMGKQVSFDIYPLNRNLGIGNSPDEAIRNSSVPNWDIEVISDE